MMEAADICNLFEDTFRQSFRVTIKGGASEPLYEPAAAIEAVIYYREDYVSSALHEIAHWCLAGEDRRQQVDYGYWYTPSRDRKAQADFEQAELKPQALEWILSEASAHAFRVSCDNFDEQALDKERLCLAIRDQAFSWLEQGLPERAKMFVEALVAESGCRSALNTATYAELPQ